VYGDAVLCGVHAVIETPAYLADAKHEGMTSDEMATAVDLIAANPQAGDLIVGSGGCRKVESPAKGEASRAAIASSPSSVERTCRYFFSPCSPRARVRTSQRPSETQ
jgi:hypothetical protein